MEPILATIISGLVLGMVGWGVKLLTSLVDQVGHIAVTVGVMRQQLTESERRHVETDHQVQKLDRRVDEHHDRIAVLELGERA